MPAGKVFTLDKEERLCSKLLIGQLFGGNASSSISAWPLRLVFLLADKRDESDAPVELLVSVSKRYFKRAVKRNRVKRQIREAYRTNKLVLIDQMALLPGKKLLMAVIWMDGSLHPSSLVEEKMQKLLRRLGEKLDESNTQDRA